MLPISQLNFGFNDAENYKRKENRDLFNLIFVRTQELDKLFEPSKYFLLGEKGAGKTAYAVFLSNNSLNNYTGRLNYIRETDYRKFIVLKQKNHLQLSDYSSIWKVIVYLLISRKVETDLEGRIFKGSSARFETVKKAIDEYYAHAFTPEIIQALSFVEDSKVSAELLLKYASVGAEHGETVSFSEDKFQTNLLYIQKQFEESLSSLKLKGNHFLFIDGIDVRPSAIPYDDYMNCIRGLADAVWSVNNDFFAGIRDSPGRIRIILLMRPDIFVSLGLQNQNNKIRDNSVLLDLRTTYRDYRSSSLFKIIDRLLGAQQEQRLDLGKAWDEYFPFKARNHRTGEYEDSSFIPFLRLSLYRPRDFVSILSILKELYVSKGNLKAETFEEKDLDGYDFQTKYSDYLLGEIKDHLAFYYSEKDYELFLKFFNYLNGSISFDYDTFTAAFQRLYAFIGKNKITLPEFLKSPDIFLQFLYELNVLGYVEEAEGDEVFVHWCFRERSYSTIAPKVTSHERYQIHSGLTKALNLGRHLIRK